MLLKRGKDLQATEISDVVYLVVCVVWVAPSLSVKTRVEIHEPQFGITFY
jgi:hypothetical protein